MNRLTRTLLPLFLILIPAGCTLPQNIATQTPVIPTEIRNTNNGWTQIAAGFEQRTFDYNNGDAEILAIRVDPQFYTFRAHYRPDEPLRLREWQETLAGEVAVINANFYAEDNTTLGIVVADGQVFGSAYRDRGGMFYVQNGVPGIRSNMAEPYNGEALEQAVQAWPLLVMDGAQAYFTESRPARRTAIGIDVEGRIILMVVSRGSTTLNGLSAFLASADDMNLVRAFNLDGGGSTMMGIEIADISSRLSSFDPVPVILAVYPQ